MKADLIFFGLIFVIIMSGVGWIMKSSQDMYTRACADRGLEVTFFRGKGVCVRRDGSLVEALHEQ